MLARRPFEQRRRRFDTQHERRAATAAYSREPPLVPPARHGRTEAHLRPNAAKTHQRNLRASRARLIEQRDEQSFGERQPLTRLHRVGAIKDEAMQHAAACLFVHEP